MGQFVERVMRCVINELVVRKLANNIAFQRFAVRTNKILEDLTIEAIRKKLASPMKSILKKGGALKS